MKNSKHIKRSILIVNIALLAALLYSLAGLMAVFEKNGDTGTGIHPAESPENGTASYLGMDFGTALSEGIDFASLASCDLFGLRNADGAELRERVTDEDVNGEEHQVPEIVLLGTVSGDETFARALIRTQGGSSVYTAQGIMLPVCRSSTYSRGGSFCFGMEAGMILKWILPGEGYPTQGRHFPGTRIGGGESLPLSSLTGAVKSERRPSPAPGRL